MKSPLQVLLRRLIPLAIVLGAIGSGGLAWAARASHAAASTATTTVSPEVTSALTNNSFGGKPLVLLVALAAMALLPFVLLMVTSFVKIAVVLSIVRSALGTQQIPPTQVITGLAIILTVYIMAPVALQMYRAAGSLDGQQRRAASARRACRCCSTRPTKRRSRCATGSRSTPPRRTARSSTHSRKRMREGPDKDSVTERDFLIIVPSLRDLAS